MQKFFPAGPAGGIAYLKALACPLPASASARPAASTPRMPALSRAANVVCVGGSWVAPKDAVAAATGRASSARAPSFPARGRIMKPPPNACFDALRAHREALGIRISASSSRDPERFERFSLTPAT